MEVRADNTNESELQATGVTREVGSNMKLTCLGEDRTLSGLAETTCVQELDSNPEWEPSLKDSKCVRKL